MHTESVGQTHVGRRRSHNEDSYLCDDDIGLCIVADGVGGHAGGEVASAESVHLVRNCLWEWRAALQPQPCGPKSVPVTVARQLLERAVQWAGQRVFCMGQSQPERRGMATTLSSLLVFADTAVIAQVGDSRVYRVRRRNVVQLTEDHTLLRLRLELGLVEPAAAATSSGRNLITRALGFQDHVEVDTRGLPVEMGDRFLLCSDGLHTYVEEGELAHLLEGDRDQVARSLIDLANERGGHDNITAVVCDIVD